MYFVSKQTSREKFIQKALCDWFQSWRAIGCSWQWLHNIAIEHIAMNLLLSQQKLSSQVSHVIVKLEKSLTKQLDASHLATTLVARNILTRRSDHPTFVPNRVFFRKKICFEGTYPVSPPSRGLCRGPQDVRYLWQGLENHVSRASRCKEKCAESLKLRDKSTFPIFSSVFYIFPAVFLQFYHCFL